ncbi:OTU domain-containing protein 5-A [Varanus komodoensis]|nr:OTU domain-containing protein 5-A [Varanus komodoensis]
MVEDHDLFFPVVEERTQSNGAKLKELDFSQYLRLGNQTLNGGVRFGAGGVVWGKTGIFYVILMTSAHSIVLWRKLTRVHLAQNRKADQVYGDQDMHEVVRKHCMDYLMKNADYFSNYVTEDFTTYINRKRKSNCHGNHIEMQAMAEMYNRPVEVYQYGTEPINTFHGIHQNEDEPIRVSYHRNIHYNSVVNPNKATIGVGLGLPSFKPGYAEQSLMKNAIKTSEESWIEQQMLEDKKRATDWEATNEAIEEQVARESYLQWLRDQEKQARQPRKASATCSSATAAAASGLEEWSGRSPRQRSSASSPEHPDLHNELNVAKPPSPGNTAALALTKPPSPCAPGE